MIEKIKILIVDDVQANIQSLAGLIEDDDVEIFSSTDTNEALSFLIDNDFGLALIDVEMPIMSGFEFARTLRSVNRHKHLPIVFVTAHQSNQSVLFEGYENGAIDMLFKPLDPHIVRQKVRAFVEFQKQKAILRAQVTELEKLRIAAESANVAKSQFLANMSHEIRTPLAAVLGFTDIILDYDITKEEREKYAESIKRNGKLLLSLIDDVLDLSKIEANQLVLERIEFDMAELFKEVAATLEAKSQKSQVSLIFKIPASLNASYLGDPRRIKQVLLNIVGNAIKFTTQGKVEVEVKEQLAGKSSLFTIRVKDEGVGISTDQAEKLFEIFSQADPSMTRKFGGTGLGLVISKKIAQACRGDIKLIESKLGRGSTFEFTLKLEHSVQTKNTSNQAAESLRPTLDGGIFLDKKILIVDDSVDNLTLIDLFLKNTQADLKFLDSSVQALDVTHSWHPEMILLDIQMPEMDGYAVLKQLRKEGYRKPILAVTAHAMLDDQKKCLDAGFDDVIVKPLSRSGLIDSLKKFF